MTNVLLLCLSTLNPSPRISKYSYDYNQASFEVDGIMTNEAPAKAIIRMLHETAPGTRLDRIVLICSDTVKKPIVLKDNDNQLEEHLKQLSSVNIEECRHESHLQLFKRLIDNYAESIDRNYRDFPIEYSEIPISDYTEDYEVSQAVIDAAGHVTSSGDKIQLFIDFNGGQRYVAFMILAISNLMKIRNVDINQIMTMNYENKVDGVIPIQNMEPVFRSFDLVAGINEYVNYGRIKGLRQYFKASENKEIKGILDQMEEFAGNLQLCRTGYVMDKRGQLLKALKDYSIKMSQIEKPDTYDQIFGYVTEDILDGYAGLLNGDLPDIINWCVDRDFVQQALTFCSEEMPGYFWSSGILKARDAEKQEYDNFLNTIHASRDNNPLKEKFKRTHQGESSKYAYEWMINYLPFSGDDRKNKHYKELLKDSPISCKKLAFIGPSPRDITNIKNSFTNFTVLDYRGLTISKELFEKAVSSAAPLIWHTNQKNSRVLTSIRSPRKFSEIMTAYYLLKGQRNLTNHADGESADKDMLSYEDLCKALKEFAKTVKILAATAK